MIHLCVGAYATEHDLAKNNRHWTHEIQTFRGQPVKLLNDNTGLKGHLDDSCNEEWEEAQDAASRKLADMADMTQSEEQAVLNTLLRLSSADSNDIIGFDWKQFHIHGTRNTIRHYLVADPSAPTYPPFAADAFPAPNPTHKNIKIAL